MADAASGATGTLVNRDAIVAEFTFVGGAKVPGGAVLDDNGVVKWGLSTANPHESRTVVFHGLQFARDVGVTVTNGTAYIEYE